MEVSVARYLRTPPEGANPQGLIRDYRAALSSETCLSIVVICNYRFGPITVDTMPGQSPIFTPSSILFRPHQQPRHLRCGSWWRRRVPPPGPNGLLHRQFMPIVSRS